MKIQAVLFDADGVVQRQAESFRSTLIGLLESPEADANAFLQDIFETERPSVTGQQSFEVGLETVLSRWHCRGTLQDALQAWEQLIVDETITDVIQRLRATGLYCGLATNQQSYRARYMSETLGYQTLFNATFYSCDLGYRKPDVRYFEAILETLSFPPRDILFIDDNEPNVKAAHQVGLNAALFQPGGETTDTVMHALLAHFNVPVS